MTEATQTATPTDARQASMSRVQTLDSILPKPATTEAATAPTEVKTEGEQGANEGESKTKKGRSERIQELVAERKKYEERAKDADARAAEAERKARELEERLNAQSAQAKPIEATPRPKREQYATEDEYIDAVTDWKSDQRIAKREQEQEQARAEAHEREMQRQWDRKVAAAQETLPDFVDVVSKADEQVPGYIVAALRKSDVGAQALYYLSLHPEEARRYAKLDPIDGIRRFRDLERDLSDIDNDKPAAKDKDEPKPQKSKAPPPIDAVKSVPATGAPAGSSYEEYKRRRLAGK